MNGEYLTIQELASVVSYQAKNEGFAIHQMLPIVMKEHPYASINDVGAELNNRKIFFRTREIIDTIIEDEGDLHKHEEDMLAGLRETGHPDDDI